MFRLNRVIFRLTRLIFRLTGLIFKLTRLIFNLTRVIFSLTRVKFTLTQVQTFTAISLNNSVYGQPSIMEITQYILKASVVCSLHFTLSLHFTHGLKSTVSILYWPHTKSILNGKDVHGKKVFQFHYFSMARYWKQLLPRNLRACLKTYLLLDLSQSTFCMLCTPPLRLWF